MELSALAWRDVTANCAYSLSVEHPPPTPPDAEVEATRVDAYVAQVKRVVEEHDLAHLRYLITDGYYSKQKFLRGMRALGLHQIGKLRADANLRYLDMGPPRPGPGRPKTYAGKVSWTDLSRWERLETPDADIAYAPGYGISAATGVAYCMGEKCVSVKEKQTMQLPLSDPDTLFEELLQDLPPAVSALAREHKAFVRAKKVKTPEQLLRLVLLYCGLDHPLRTVAGMFTALYEPITDQSVAERLQACGPWVKALLRDMLPSVPVAPLPAGYRFRVIAASTVQAPGATGTDHRLHLCMDLVS